MLSMQNLIISATIGLLVRLISCHAFTPAAVSTFGPLTSHFHHGVVSSQTQLFLAKSTKKKKSSKTKASSGGGLKGFGGIASSSKSSYESVDIDRSKEAREFYDFLEKGSAGDTLSRCALGYFPLDEQDTDLKLRGVVALKHLKKGDNLIRIPYELAINLGQEGADPTIPALSFLREYCQVLRDEETGKEASSFQKLSYFRMLPGFRGEDCMGSTDFFSDDALEALQAPLIVEETMLRRQLIKARFESDIDDKFPLWIDGTPITIEHLQWAVWLITSRVLTVQGAEDEGKSFRLLIPFLDMCNHDRSSAHVLTGRAVAGGELKVVAGAAVKEGEQINICYGGGMAGNDRFVQDYGFLDSSDNSKAYAMVAQQLLGKRRIVEGVGAGRLMSEADTGRTLEQLRSTTMDQDKKLLESAKDPQMKAAYRYSLGVKEALSKFIVIQ
jgi:hypothetical protein